MVKSLLETGTSKIIFNVENDIVVLVAPSVSAKSRKTFTDMGCRVVDIPNIENP